MKLSAIAVGALGAVATTVLSISLTSNAAFSATTANTSATPNATVGTVTISDNDAGASLINAINIAPGATGSSCITVNYTGSLRANVKLYARQTGTLGNVLNTTVEEGNATGNAFGDCTGFTATSTTYTGKLDGLVSHGDYINGLGSWSPASAASKTYRVTWALPSTVGNEVQGAQSNIELTWEAQNI